MLIDSENLVGQRRCVMGYTLYIKLCTEPCSEYKYNGSSANENRYYFYLYGALQASRSFRPTQIASFVV
jgi:hypothetical protein